MTSVPVPMCWACANRIGDTLTCTAYPDGIPDPILDSEIDHRYPYEGDNGIVFQQRPDTPPPDFGLLFPVDAQNPQ